MEIPYISVKQRGEIFFVSRFNANDLKKMANFHFRDPYYKYYNSKKRESYDEYICKIQKQGIELKSSEKGIQRRLQYDRIVDIKNFIEKNNDNFFPSSVLLSIDVSNDESFELKYNKMIEEEVGYFNLDEESIINIIDGQHRLGGIFSCDDNIIETIQIPAIILFNVSVSTAAKLFWDINGKQKPVNKSLVYDLYEDIDESASVELKGYHTICQKLYMDMESPLYRQIKMLGVGDGAISQSFFIDTVKMAIDKTDLKYKDLQEKYSNIFMYFRAFQEIFSEDWPVPLEIEKYSDILLDEYARDVLIVRKSQLAKTNGFGAIMGLFPYVYQKVNADISMYKNVITQLKNKVEWVQSGGTGKAIQNKLRNLMHEILFCCKVEVTVDKDLLNHIVVNRIVQYDYEGCAKELGQFKFKAYEHEDELILEISKKFQIAQNNIYLIKV